MSTIEALTLKTKPTTNFYFKREAVLTFTLKDDPTPRTVYGYGETNSEAIADALCASSVLVLEVGMTANEVSP